MLSWAGALRLWPDAPAELHRIADIGLVAFFGLVTWWGITGFSGYEHRAGLRIIGRHARSGRRTWLWVWLGVAALGLLALHFGFKSVALVLAVAAGTFFALLVLLIRRFSVFGTISIVGVVLGVAALIVVQSVATGFQHEFERRVLGVYAHINVTRAFGISEYRRFESYLRTLPGVQGASPFVYYAMAIAPHDREEQGDNLQMASVLVKGIEPRTAAEVIDLPDHLARGSAEPVQLDALSSNVELQPVPDRDESQLPDVIAQTPDPRGDGWYERAIKHYRGLPEHERYRVPGGGGDGDDWDDDEWPDEGELASAGSLDPELLPTMFIGATLARELDLEVGQVVILVDPGATFDHTEAPQFQHYRIAGLFQAGFQEYDSRLVYIHIKELQRFKYRGKDIVSGVDVRLDDPYGAPAIERGLKNTIGDQEYSILEWQKLNANLFNSIRTQKSVITIILSLVITVASFNVLAALWTMVVRRTAEIAIMMSMGATDSAVARIFQFTGMTIGLAGSLAGVGFGLVLCWLVELYGYTLDPEVYFIERLPVEISPVQIAAVLAMTMGICFVATIPPSLRAARLRPVEGLRYE